MPGMNSASAAAFHTLSTTFYSTWFSLVAVAFLVVLLVGFAILLLRIELKPTSFLNRFQRPWIVGEDRSTHPRARFLQISFGFAWIIDGLFQLRPDMPGGFVTQVANSALTGAPRWLTDLSLPLLRLWDAHPIKIDIVTAFVQLSIGLAFVLLRRTTTLRVVLYLSLAWLVFVLVPGNGLGIFYPGASFLSGAPGAPYLYGFVSIYLLASQSGRKWAESDRALALAIAVFFVIGAALQALPSEGLWKSGGIESMARSMSQAGQPGFLSSGLSAFARLASSSPQLLNGIMIALVLAAAVGLYVRPQSRALQWFAFAVAFIGWWFGQDFGIFSSTATDFNSGLPLMLLVFSLRKDVTVPAPQRNPRVEKVVKEVESAVPAITPTYARHWLMSFPLIGLVLSSLIAGIALLGPTSASMALVDSGGAISIPAQTAPNFQLQNYNGRPISLSQLRGRAIVLTFLDPTCYDQCPLFAQEMVATDRLLGKQASKVALVAVVANPITHTVGAVKDFTVTHDLATYRNWYYLTGSLASLRQVWKDYSVTVSVNSVGMVVHSSQFYFISPNGTERALMDNTGNPQLAQSYTSVIYKEEKALL